MALEPPKLANLAGMVLLGTGVAHGLIGTAQAKSRNTVPAELRNATEPVPLIVLAEQKELRTGRDPGGRNGDGSGGLLGEILAGAIQSNQMTKANAKVDPIRDALVDFDTDAPLMAGIRKGVAELAWITLPDGLPIHEISAQNSLSAKLSGNNAGLVACSYSISPHFHALYVQCRVQIVKKQELSVSDQKTEAVFRNTAEVEVDLADVVALDSDHRKALWMDNSAGLLHKGLAIGPTDAGLLVGRELSQTDAQLDAARANPSAHFMKRFVGEIAEHQGPVLEGQDNIRGYQTMDFVIKVPIIAPDSQGVVIVESGGALYEKRTLSRQ